VKVAVVFRELDAEVGGGLTFAESVLEGLRSLGSQSHGHELVIYAPRAVPIEIPQRRLPPSRYDRVRKGALRLVRVAQDQLGTRRLGLRTRFERALAADGIQLVWFSTNLAEECDLPFIFTVFDLAHLECQWFPEVAANGEWERRWHLFRRYIPRATAVIVPNEVGREQVQRHFGLQDDRVLCLPHPTPQFALEAADRNVSPDGLAHWGIGRPYLLYPAQLWAHKNHYGLLRALRELRDRGAGYELVLVGSDRGQRGYIERLIEELELGGRVHLLGFVETEALIALYKHAHALVYLSYIGPESFPPLEAGALGCPVVAADIPGARQQLGDAVLLVDPTDPVAVANAVTRLEDGAVRAELLARGRKLAEERTAEAYVRGVLDFLDEFESVRGCWP
jgi:glycosyltransferase involved in cell wall biosynthesis